MKKFKFYFKLIIIISIIYAMVPAVPVFASQYRENTPLSNFNSTKYPGYKEKLETLQSAHPNWTFTFLYTGLDWSTAINNESINYHGRSLVQNKTGEWICPICGNKVYDGSNWYCSSPKAVSYYMDPRNALTEEKVFQFETLSYVDGLYTEEGIEAILNGTFMNNKTIREYYNNPEYTESKFSTVILQAGNEANVSPYHLASRIKQEIIVSGGEPSNSVTGKLEGYEGLYNFYNIGASSGEGAVERGLKYANAKGWVKPEIAIKDGAKIIAQNYISRNQNTVYLEKFDVDSSDNSLYSHQYMQNIQAPTSEAKRIYKNTYLALGIVDNKFNFVIPVYENMPGTACELPSDIDPNATNNNNGEEIVKVIANGSLKLRESPTTDSAVIASLPTNTQLTRLESNVAFANNFQWDKVRTSYGTVGYVASKYIQSISNNNNNNNNSNLAVDSNDLYIDSNTKMINCSPKINFDNLKGELPGKSIVLKNNNGEVIADNINIGTGMTVSIDNVDYRIVKYGDVSGDGIVDARDSLRILKYSVGEYNLDDKVYFNAGDVNRDNVVDARDSLRVLKYSVGSFEIKAR